MALRDMAGEEIAWEGGTYRVVQVHKSVRFADGSRGLPVTVIRTEAGLLIPGLENLGEFMLDADEAAAGVVKVLAKR